MIARWCSEPRTSCIPESDPSLFEHSRNPQIIRLNKSHRTLPPPSLPKAVPYQKTKLRLHFSVSFECNRIQEVAETVTRGVKFCLGYKKIHCCLRIYTQEQHFITTCTFYIATVKFSNRDGYHIKNAFCHFST